MMVATADWADRGAARRAAFFDRDGTLNVDDGYTWRVEHLHWQPGAMEAVRRCNEAGLAVILITNQSGIARGYFGEEDMRAFHARMQVELAAHGARLDAIYFSPFHSESVIEALRVADHPNRKPNPGMLRRAMIEHRIAPERSFMVGDSDADVKAAAAAGLVSARVAPGQLLAAVERLIVQTADTAVPDLRERLHRRAERTRNWLFEAALPLWWEKGFDRTACAFHEKLDLKGTPIVSPRRVRVQARQTFVYALAGDLGWSGPWADAVSAGVDVLVGRCLRPDGGTRHLLDAQGRPLDDRRDLYDLAFVVLALSHAGRVLHRLDLIDQAARQIDWLEQAWPHPNGGFLEGEIASRSPRNQNPHMHLFEALLALHSATGEPRHLERASQLGRLFIDRIHDPANGLMSEHFDDTWTPPASSGQRIVEPGHCYEWSWLLDRWRAQGGEDRTRESEALWSNAEILGVDHSGYTMDAVCGHGGPLLRTARLWPQTERIKASLTRYLREGDRYSSASCDQACAALDSYSDNLPPGLWRDRRAADGAFVDEPAPASSFYHVMLAGSELISAFGSR